MAGFPAKKNVAFTFTGAILDSGGNPINSGTLSSVIVQDGVAKVGPVPVAVSGSNSFTVTIPQADMNFDVITFMPSSSAPSTVEGSFTIITSTNNIDDVVNPLRLQRTTIATLASQTSFTLTAGSPDNNAYNNLIAIITDSVTAEQKAVAFISAYVGATKTVTLIIDPAVFTMAAGDSIDIIAADDVRNIVSNTGVIVAVNNDKTSYDLNADQSAVTVGTVTTNTDMRGTDNAALASVATEARLAELDSANIPTDLSDMKGAGFLTGTDSLEAIRDRGDLSWKTGLGGSNPQTLQTTTIATLASQTSFTLTAGSSDNNAYNNLIAVITDSVTAEQKALAFISAYVGATKTVTLVADPGIFTMAVGDNIDIIAADDVRNIVSNTGVIVAVNNDKTAYDLNADQSAVTVGTVTANTDMRGTDNGLLAASAPTNFGDLAITATTGRTDVGSWLGTAVTTSPTSLKPEIDVKSVSDDTVAADNLELQFDTTGLTGGTFPSTQDALASIPGGGGGAERNTPPTAVTFTTGTGAGLFTDAKTQDGVYVSVLHAAGVISVQFDFDIGVSGIPLSVKPFGRMHGDAIKHTIVLEAFDEALGVWEGVGSFTGKTATTAADDKSQGPFDLLSGHNGIGANLGKVKIRFVGTGLGVDNAQLFIDQVIIGFEKEVSVIGYENSAVWLDTVNGTAGTVLDVHGVGDKPSLTLADANTILTNKGLTRFEVVGISSILLVQAQDGNSFFGETWTLALGGQSISGSFIHGAVVSGIATGANKPVFEHCRIGTSTFPPSMIRDSGFSSTLTAGAAGTYFIDACHSMLASSGFMTFDFAAVGNVEANFRGFKGGIELQNMSAGDTCSIDGNGQYVLNANCTGGTVVVRGSFEKTDNSGGSVAITETARYDTLQINAQADLALSDVNLDHLVGTATAIPAIPSGTFIDQMLDDGTATYDRNTDSLQAIRDRGDIDWKTGAGGSDPTVLQKTTISTLASQTSFTLTAGSPDNNAYNNLMAVVTDSVTATQKAIAFISAYVGSSRTITLVSDPAVFTMAVGDSIDIIASDDVRNIVSNTGVVVAINNDKTAYDLNADQSAVTVGTVTTNTDMRGTDNAALASVATEARLAELDSANIPTDLSDMKGAGFLTGTDSLEAIRDRGDLSWKTGAGGSNPATIQETTIATLASQTSFTLTAGSSDNNAYKNLIAVITDSVTAEQKAVAFISAYIGSTKTVTLVVDPAVFTMAAGDSISIIASDDVRNIVSNAGVIVAVNNDKTAYDLNANQGAVTVGTVTTNTDMRGTDSAALASVATEARLAELDSANIPTDIAAVKADTAAIKLKTDNLPSIFKKNVAINNFPFFMESSTDGKTGVTGLTITGTILKDNGTFVSMSNVFTEISGGFYRVNLTAADMNADKVTLKFTGTAANDRILTIATNQ